jgi:hypothetical protein
LGGYKGWGLQISKKHILTARSYLSAVNIGKTICKKIGIPFYMNSSDSELPACKILPDDLVVLLL